MSHSKKKEKNREKTMLEMGINTFIWKIKNES